MPTLEITYVLLACGYVSHGAVAVASDCCRLEPSRRVWQTIEHGLTVILGAVCVLAAVGYANHH